MVKQFKKGLSEKLSNNFSSTDFDCKCTHEFCTYTLVDTDLVASLDPLEDIFAKLVINSGFRCTVHNKDIGGKPGSMHLVGKAADIHSQFASPAELYYASNKIKMFAEGGIGVYNNFIHVDVRGYHVRWNLELLT